MRGDPRLIVGVAIFAYAASAHASPNVSLDDPVYNELAGLPLPPYLGGLQPLTEDRVRQLLRDADVPDVAADPSGWWIVPIARAADRFSLFHETDRPYSTPLRPRDVAGAIALSCEHQEGRPCGDGVGGTTEIDSSAGYGTWASGSVRLRLGAGTEAYDSGFELDRGYVNAHVGVVAIEVGRDILVLGPSSRTQLGWGDNAPPLDQVRLATARPLEITSSIRGSLDYVLGRLRDPQTYPNDLVSIARGQLDLGDSVELGMMQMLQLEGDGAPHLGFWDFIEEHFTRKDASASVTDSSNRRVGFDASAKIEGLHARLYYEIVFEDWRQQFQDALRYDADHLFGYDAGHGLIFEIQKTGVRSQEHYPRTTGFTNDGRVVGSPLGPDALSLYGSARFELGRTTLTPWAEIAQLSSDEYTFIDHGPILHATEGIAEYRYRGGTKWRVPLWTGVRLDVEVMFEHVANEAFEPGARAENYGLTTTFVWQPRGARFP